MTAIKKDKRVRKHNIIEALNFDYSGPIDGHDLNALIAELNRLKEIKGPKFLHIITTKGKGLHKAELDQVKYHAPGKFDAKTGEIYTKAALKQPPKYQDVFGLTLVELARQNKKIIGITPAMPTGSSLKFMLDEIPERSFDVGIAEQHAVTLAAGMATQGIIPFCNIYSTFLQRAYDQVIHDVALQKLPVVFCLDRAGIVGQDGATHHGVFDLAYLRCIPNLVIFAPLNELELRNMMYTAQMGLDTPVAIRYPRGRGVFLEWQLPFEELDVGKGTVIKEGSDLAILSIGHIGNKVIDICESFPEREKIAHYNMRFVKPLDEPMLHHIFKKFNKIITIEDGTVLGGFGSAVLEFAQEHRYHAQIKRLGIPDQFIEHGTSDELFQSLGLGIQEITKIISSHL